MKKIPKMFLIVISCLWVLQRLVNCFTRNPTSNTEVSVLLFILFLWGFYAIFNQYYKSLKFNRERIKSFAFLGVLAALLLIVMAVSLGG